MQPKEVHQKETFILQDAKNAEQEEEKTLFSGWLFSFLLNTNQVTPNSKISIGKTISRTY